MLMNIELEKDQILMKEGEPSDLIYILISGELTVYKYEGNAKKHNVIGYILPGEMVGEMSFLENLPRSATVKATTDCKLGMMNRPSFDKLIQTQDPIIQNLIVTLSQRLRKSNKKIQF